MSSAAVVIGTLRFKCFSSVHCFDRGTDGDLYA